jgi:hypothetical protein
MNRNRNVSSFPRQSPDLQFQPIFSIRKSFTETDA